jgi:hypothetical protein
MSGAPDAGVTSAIESGVAQVTRRIEVYEADGETPWYASSDDDPVAERLVDGSVTLDYNSDERRKGDITLRNDDLAFRLNPLGGFYYDKIIKLYRGVKYKAVAYKPKIAMIESDYSGDQYYGIVRQFARAGYELVDVRTATTYAEIADYPIIANLKNVNVATKDTLLNEAYLNGHHVLTMGWGSTVALVPHIATTAAHASANVELQKITATDHFLRDRVPALSGSLSSTEAGLRVATLTSRGYRVAVNANATSSLIMTLGINAVGAKWFNWQQSALILSSQATILAPYLKGILDYMATDFKDEINWESQLGEFMIDQVNDKVRVPNQVKVTFRDRTKKLIKSKITFTSTFKAGTPLKTFVRAIASNGGITKFRENIGDETFPVDMSFDRDTERWKMIKDACFAFNYECFFDAEGYLVVRKFIDPTTSILFHRFATGSDGNLVSFDRSINDSRIYNIINVFGDPVSGDRLPYFGQAINDDLNSPTNIYRLGERPRTYSFNYFSSDEECVRLAYARLKIEALESYEIDFSSIYYPWMEVGETVEILDPYRNETDPTRFLMDSVTLPLALGPMSGTGKRVTIVGSAG